jgi:tetratricopeptide (TPR) repeat protein
MQGALTKTRKAGDRQGRGAARRDTPSLDQLAAEAFALVTASDDLVTADDRKDRLGAYRAALSNYKKLARRDPSNAEWQCDLAVCHNKIGDVLLAEGNRAAALGEYRQSLAIVEELARRDPGNAGWQRDLSVSHNRIGDMLLAEGNRTAALGEYRQSLAIREALVRRDPGNAGWQRGLSISREKIGDVLFAEGNRAAALGEYRQNLAIAEELARRDPGNAEWQHDLSVCRDRIGNVLLAEGNRAAALGEYRQSLAIREALVRRDPGNAEWQNDLAYVRDTIFEIELEVVESKSPGYTGAAPSSEAAVTPPLPMGEMEAIDTLVRLHGEGVRKLIRDYVAAKNETAAPATAPVWPSEKWATSPEKMSRKLHAIEAYMRRVWKPFIEETGAVVTFAMLRKIDKKAGEAWASYVVSHGAVADIPIVSTKELAGTVSERPAVFAGSPRAAARMSELHK